MLATLVAAASLGHLVLAQDVAPSVWKMKNEERHLFLNDDGTFIATTNTKEGYRGFGGGTYKIKGGVLTITALYRVFRDGKEKGAEKIQPGKESQLAFKGSSISAGGALYERVKTQPAVIVSSYANYQEPAENNRVTLYGKTMLWDLSMKPGGVFKTFVGQLKANKAFAELTPMLGGDPTVFTPEGKNSEETKFAEWVMEKGLPIKMLAYVDEDGVLSLISGPFVPAAPPVLKYPGGR